MATSKQLTAYKWYLKGTGKEYIVNYHTEVGVEDIVSIYAVVWKGRERIDITEAETIDGNVDATIEALIDWDEQYMLNRYETLQP